VKVVVIQVIKITREEVVVSTIQKSTTEKRNQAETIKIEIKGNIEMIMRRKDINMIKRSNTKIREIRDNISMIDMRRMINIEIRMINEKMIEKKGLIGRMDEDKILEHRKDLKNFIVLMKINMKDTRGMINLINMKNSDRIQRVIIIRIQETMGEIKTRVIWM
jgi:hypothetical protein